MGAVDPPYDIESENSELWEDGADKVVEDGLSHSSIRDIKN